MADLLVFTVELSIGSTIAADAGEAIDVESVSATALDVTGSGVGASVESLASGGLDVTGSGVGASVESLASGSLNVRSAQ